MHSLLVRRRPIHSSWSRWADRSRREWNFTTTRLICTYALTTQNGTASDNTTYDRFDIKTGRHVRRVAGGNAIRRLRLFRMAKMIFPYSGMIFFSPGHTSGHR
jgi:hypothetical protein